MSTERHGDDATRPAARPSAVARERLAARVRRDVADIRVRLEEASLRSDAYLAAGYPDDAREVLDEQEALLEELREQVTAAVAAAAVEAEAEAVLSGCSDAGALFGEPDPRRAPVDLRRSGARTAASALVSAVAALAFLVMVSTPPGPRTLAAAGVDDRPAETDDAPSEASSDASSRAPADAAGAADDHLAGPNELEVRRLFSSPTPRAGATGGPGDAAGPRTQGLDATVDGLLAEAIRAVEGVVEEARRAGDELWTIRRDARTAEEEAQRRAEDDGERDAERDGEVVVTDDSEDHGEPPAEQKRSDERGADDATAEDGDGDQAGDPSEAEETDASDEGDEDDAGGVPSVDERISGSDGLVGDR